MNRIDAVFKRLKQEQKTAFIGFLTAGDPDIPTCMECVKQLEQNSCDIIEIGIPFSDPIAEGPVIQEASLRALQNDITTETVMRMVSNNSRVLPDSSCFPPVLQPNLQIWGKPVSQRKRSCRY